MMVNLKLKILILMVLALFSGIGSASALSTSATLSVASSMQIAVFHLTQATCYHEGTSFYYSEEDTIPGIITCMFAPDGSCSVSGSIIHHCFCSSCGKKFDLGGH